MKLLIVEDNASMRRLIKSTVRDLADEISECSDGAEALNAYSRNHPDFVLMDVQMKEKDGITATREIVGAFPEARVLIVTNHGEAAFRQAAVDAGACAYVLKENLEQIREVLVAGNAVSKPNPFALLVAEDAGWEPGL